MKLEKTNVPGFVKDRETNTIINTNESDYSRILESRKKSKEMHSLKLEIFELKKEIEKIKKHLNVS